MNLYFIVIGATPKGRLVEQHDVFFGIAKKLKDLIPNINKFWPETNGKFHIDSYRNVCYVEDFEVSIVPKGNYMQSEKLYFINLGGYLPNDMEEYHFKTIVVAKDKTEAIKKAKETEFYKKFSFKGAESHIDDQFGVDIDDIHEIEDILLPEFKTKYSISLAKIENKQDDLLKIGYLSLSKLEKSDF